MAREEHQRAHPRQLRRLQVRFWGDREDKARQGFTKNLSVSGAFITTPDPPGRGERLHVELAEEGRRVRLHAEVVHSYRVPPEFRRFAEAAMGVRFLDLEELVGPFLPAATRPAGIAVPRRAAGSEAAPSPAGSEAEPGPATAGAGPADEMAGDDGAASADGGEAAPAGTLAGTGRVFRRVFESAEEFLSTYRRDLVNGGLFVSTGRPAGLQERVGVDLQLPGAEGLALRLDGRVVQVVEPRDVGGGRTLGGMGLEILELDRALAALAPLVASYEG